MAKEHVKTMKKKDLIRLDEEIAKRLQAEFNKEERLVRKKDEANISLTEEWDDIQAKICRREEEQTTNPSSTKKNHVYLPEEYGKKKPKDLKNKSFDSIQKMFDRAFKRVNTFVDFKTDLVKDILNKKLHVDYFSKMAYQLLKLLTKQLKNQRSVWKHPPDDYRAFNGET
ncbi:hypothetical protein Tco_1262240 [Tanacetum coccineum]